MPADLRDSEGRGPHQLVLPDRLDGQLSALAELELALADTVAATASTDAENTRVTGAVVLVAGSWPLDARQLEEIDDLLSSRSLKLIAIHSSRAETRVAAAGLGLRAEAPEPAHLTEAGASTESRLEQARATSTAALRLHQGTLRSGDHLDIEGSLLLLGDVNPGASIRASGHVLVWGRLRGIAHAGADGDREARIVALQLRPLQLRIADAVARGPEGVPPPGLAEEAALLEGTIQIRAAAPGWPLSD